MADQCRWLHEQLRAVPAIRFPFDPAALPENGIYFFYEDGETDGHGSEEPRIVRVGSHRDGNFRSRVADHYLFGGRQLKLHVDKPAPKDRSIFRKNIGRSLLAQARDPYLEIWNIDFTTVRNRRVYAGQRNIAKEREIEEEVTRLLREAFSFRYLTLDSALPRLGKDGLESALIGTVAICHRCNPSGSWLGHHSPIAKIRQSGLWQIQHLNCQAIDDEDKETIKAALSRALGMRKGDK